MEAKERGIRILKLIFAFAEAAKKDKTATTGYL
jgi:hypothetical protein